MHHEGKNWLKQNEDVILRSRGGNWGGGGSEEKKKHTNQTAFQEGIRLSVQRQWPSKLWGEFYKKMGPTSLVHGANAA